MSTAESTRLTNLDPNIAGFLQKLEAQGGPPLYTLSPNDARAVLSRVQQSVKVAAPPADIEDRTINGGPTGQISLRIVRPQNAKGALAPVIYLHGGGWVLGDETTFDRLFRALARSPLPGGPGTSLYNREVGRRAGRVSQPGYVAARHCWRQRGRQHGDS